MQNPCRINIRKSFTFRVGLQKLHVLKPGTWNTLEHVKRKKETSRIVFLRMDVFSFFLSLFCTWCVDFTYFFNVKKPASEAKTFPN